MDVRRSGHTLVELLVALVLLQVGILAAVGTCLLAQRTLTEAELMDWGASEVQRVLDSLASATWGATEAEAASGPGTLRWTVAPSGAVRVQFLLADSPLVTVEGRLALGEGTGG